MNKIYLTITVLFSGFFLSGCNLQKLQIIDSSDLRTIGDEYSSFMTNGSLILCYDNPEKNEINSDNFVLIDGKNYGRVIRDVDLSEFETINNLFGKDENVVYYRCQPIIGSDPKTYELLSGAYDFGIDKNNVYRQTEIIVNADPKTFVNLGGAYSKDKNGIYYLSDKMEGADPSSFVVLNSGYAKDDNNVYYSDLVVQNADPKTFVNLGKEYYKDKNSVYFNGKLVEGMDPDTSTFLGYMYYAKDKDNIYFDGEKIDGSDAKSFRYFGSYVRDDTGIYIEGKRFTNYDEETLKYLGFLYFKDKDSVYRDGLLVSSSPESFTLIQKEVETENDYYVNVYAKDSNSVFYGSKKLENLDPAKVKYFLDENNNDLVTDGRCTYRMDTLLNCID